MSFKGAKLALFLGPKLLVILRDEKPEVPFPGYWDFPGGGRESAETPQACVLRETYEEVGLVVAPSQLCYERKYSTPNGDSWFFVAHLQEQIAADIRFGDEGQGWDLMLPTDYLQHPLGIPNFQHRLHAYLQRSRDA